MIVYCIDLSYACYAVVVQDGIVVRAPPIARWMIHKPWKQCWLWLQLKGATIHGPTKLEQ